MHAPSQASSIMTLRLCPHWMSFEADMNLPLTQQTCHTSVNPQEVGGVRTP